MWGLLGIALSPLVVYCSALLSETVGASDASGRGTVDAGGHGAPEQRAPRACLVMQCLHACLRGSPLPVHVRHTKSHAPGANHLCNTVRRALPPTPTHTHPTPPHPTPPPTPPRPPRPPPASVSSIITMDFSTYASLMATTALLAPLLEETVFRGFLLTSLTKWMPVPAAVALSSLAFGMVHLTPRDFPQVCSPRLPR